MALNEVEKIEFAKLLSRADEGADAQWLAKSTLRDMHQMEREQLLGDVVGEYITPYSDAVGRHNVLKADAYEGFAPALGALQVATLPTSNWAAEAFIPYGTTLRIMFACAMGKDDQTADWNDKEIILWDITAGAQVAIDHASIDRSGASASISLYGNAGNSSNYVKDHVFQLTVKPGVWFRRADGARLLQPWVSGLFRTGTD